MGPADLVVRRQEDKLEPSEQLGDLLRSAGDADAALKCYRASGATTKVIEGMHFPSASVIACVAGLWALLQQ